MNIKYTKGGKKVVVLGKLNSESWIVQEVFVSNGQEFPAGENFVETTLLDEPAETWQMKEAKRLDGHKQEVEKEIENLRNQAKVARRNLDYTNLINRITAKYGNAVEIDQLDTLFAFMAGHITHIVIKKWNTYEILSLVDALKAEDSWNGYKSVDGIKLVSLFGCNRDGERYEKDRGFSLNWRINEYRDGSGSCTTAYPCKSHQEAVELIDELLATHEEATSDLIELKKKYHLKNPSKEKIKKFHEKLIDQKKESIDKQRKELLKSEDELKVLKGRGA